MFIGELIPDEREHPLFPVRIENGSLVETLQIGDLCRGRKAIMMPSL